MSDIDFNSGLVPHTVECSLTYNLPPYHIDFHTPNGGKILSIGEDKITWYKNDGTEVIIDDEKELIFALSDYIMMSTDLRATEYYKKRREDMFNDIMSMVGLENERIIKIRKIFNEKNK